MDWVRHACPNVIALPAQVNIEKMTPFVQKAESEVQESFLLFQRGADKTIRERTVPSFVNSGLVEWTSQKRSIIGDKPDFSGVFKVEINGQAFATGTAPNDMEWEGNKKVPALGGNTSKSKPSYVSAWLKEDEEELSGQRHLQRVGERHVYLASSKVGVALPEDGILKVRLTTPQNETIKLKGPYALPESGNGMLHAWDSQKGVEALVKFEDGVAKEVKVVVPALAGTSSNFAANAASASTSSFSIDATNPEHLIGLSMALEHLRAEGAVVNPENAGILRKHVCSILYDGADHKVNSELNVAVYQSVNELQKVEARPLSNLWRRGKKAWREAGSTRALEKRLKTFETKEEFEDELDNLLAEAKNLQQSGSTGEDKVILLETLRDYAKSNRLPDGKPILLTPSKVFEISTLRTNVKEIEGSKRGKAQADRKRGKAAQKAAAKPKQAVVAPERNEPAVVAVRGRM